MYYNHLKNGGKEKNKQTSEAFNAQKFVDRLINEGTKVYCYETRACDKCELPPFYDEQLYKKGQQFFYKHMFAMLFAKFNGLLAVLSTPSVLKILMLTQKSSSDFSAYVRYMSTIFHMIIWYQEDLEPGSRLWKSISEVNKKHSYASKKSCSAGLQKISQKDMAFTQFGFMGFQVSRSEMIGIHNASDEEFKAFIHVWKVVGYLMGIEERYNICRESVQETRDICNVLITTYFYPEVNKRDKDYFKMSRHLIRGMWSQNPMLAFKPMMSYLYTLLKPSQTDITNSSQKELFNLSFAMKLRLWIIGFHMTVLLRYNIFRGFLNFLEHLSMWLMEVCPFLAYYSFGKADTIVKIKV